MAEQQSAIRNRFSHLRNKIETCAATDNLASWKIMEKLGFHRTNKIKKVKYTILTEEVDCYCYEITREEYLNLVSK